MKKSRLLLLCVQVGHHMPVLFWSEAMRNDREAVCDVLLPAQGLCEL